MKKICLKKHMLLHNSILRPLTTMITVATRKNVLRVCSCSSDNRTERSGRPFLVMTLDFILIRNLQNRHEY